MGGMCGDNRFEIIQKAKEEILADTNIASSPKEMEVLGSLLFRCWQMGWLDKYDANKPKTNADRIREMSDEELAEWLHNGISSDACDFCKYENGHCDGSRCWGKAEEEIIAEWLKQPAKENER